MMVSTFLDVIHNGILANRQARLLALLALVAAHTVLALPSNVDTASSTPDLVDRAVNVNNQVPLINVPWEFFMKRDVDSDTNHIASRDGPECSCDGKGGSTGGCSCGTSNKRDIDDDSWSVSGLPGITI